ncbi:MAG: hypothetical protein JRC92_11440 [Deltaproteobacteria bacterium]|nr:hypothetical protein [Deltaproteobacteria bacterium]
MAALLIREYLGREAPDDLDELNKALAEVKMVRRWRAEDFAKGITLAFGEGD